MYEKENNGKVGIKMIDVGVVCIKLAGRDAGKTCVVVDKLDNKYVVIDGETRRKKCNLKHLAPTGKTLKIKKGATTAEVRKALASEGVKAKEKKEKTKVKTKTAKPKPKRKVKDTKKTKEEKKKKPKK